MVGARVRRQQVAYAQGRGLSRRRACALLSVARSTLGVCVTTRGAGCAGADGHARRSPASIPRYGYRRDSDLPEERPGHVMSADRTHRLWRQAGLQVPRRRPRRRVATSRPRPRAGDRTQSRVGVRLRLRYLREWPEPEVPHDHRRMDARVPGDRCSRRHPLGTRHRGPRAARERAWGPALPAVGQRTRIRGAVRFCAGSRRRRSRRR